MASGKPGFPFRYLIMVPVIVSAIYSQILQYGSVVLVYVALGCV